MTQTVLITGANRGIGLALARNYAARGDRVVAAVRDPAKMPAVDGAVVVALDVGAEDGAVKAVDEAKKHGIDRLDVVIANAGVDVATENFADVSPTDLLETWRVNVLGPVLLFQATHALAAGGKFVVVSSSAGTIDREHGPGRGAYGQSKAAVNYFTRKAHFENADRVVFSLNPGWVKTDMGNRAAQHRGWDSAKDDIDVTCPGMVKIIDEATRDNYSGWMVNWDGTRMPY